MDFYKIVENCTKRDHVEITPDYKVCRSKDLMVRGNKFYAIWNEELGLWSTDVLDVQKLIDDDLDRYAEKRSEALSGSKIDIKYLSSEKTKRWRDFLKHIGDMPDNYHQLDMKMTFVDTPVEKKDYISKRLPYELKEGSIETYLEFMQKLYSDEERQKFEWAIGSIIAGDSVKIQKFFVFYGGPGTGKSTVLNLIQKICEGYWCNVDVKAMTTQSNQFALETLKSNPLVAIQHDGDLSKIDDNTRLNSIVSHEPIVMNEKFKAQYQMKPNCLLFIGTNTPVKITDGKSGLKRRLIDITPTGEKWDSSSYHRMNSKIMNFEVGAIAYHCLKVYESLGENYYKNYEPVEMMYKTDLFFNFVEENYELFKSQDGTTLKQAHSLYKEYADANEFTYKMSKPEVREKLKDYFDIYKDEDRSDNSHLRHVYKGFKWKIFNYEMEKEVEVKKVDDWLIFKKQESKLDEALKDCPAQYASEEETPKCKWANVKTTLKDISTDKLHYVKPDDEHHIVIDFDIKDGSGKKSFKKNAEEAAKWPKTYAELSKSGEGIHLHYIYTGDSSNLSRLYSDNVEVKVFTGNSSLRRKLTKCNDISIATIDSGLPLKESKGDKMVNIETVGNEKHLRALIKKNLRKEIHSATKPSIDFINELLEQAYNSGMHYDVTDMRPAILAFGANSTNQAEACIKIVNKMHFCSEDVSEVKVSNSDEPIVFYDIEVFPNLFLINWKKIGENNPVIRMINPSPKEVEELLSYKLVGFNCRRYDNHVSYARMMGYINDELYRLSQRIIQGSENCFFKEAYNISYTDIYDYSSTKQSLKKWEIQLGIHHQELGLPWDKPVPEEKWPLVAEYCDNDVLATEAVWHATQADFVAREILAEVAGGIVNDTTNSLTTKIIFGSDRNPQEKFKYRNLGEPVYDISIDMMEFLTEKFPEMMAKPHGKAKSILPYFEGYKYEGGNSSYREFNGIKSEKNPEGKYVGEGGLVWSAPGMYGRTKTYDVMSEHPHSAMAEYIFGIYTRRLNDLVEARAAIKHKDISKAKTLLNGVLEKYLSDESLLKTLSYALKIAINSVYGLTAAKFANAFKDPRNIDNIVAKRGALFMIDLKHEVEAMGGKVIHIKTDSIKVVDPTPEIEEFIFSFGKRYGYTFEIEHVFKKICLVNDAVYVAQLADDDPEAPGTWTATGTQFAVPYVFKTLFSKEDIRFEDLCETKEVKSALYLDMNETLPEVSIYEDEKAYRKKGLTYKNRELMAVTDEELDILISKGHSYRFIGKVGQFCPVKDGTGGGLLLRESVNKNTGETGYSAATGTKGYRWLESEVIRNLKKEDSIDIRYYTKLVDDAIAEINKYGDFELFVSNQDISTEEELPWTINKEDK